MSYYFIEVIKSSFTGNTLYSKPIEIAQLGDVLNRTKACKYLTTVDVIKFRWMIEKNGICWYHGIRKLQPIPWVYTIPPLHFLNGTIAPKKVFRYETVKREVVEPVKSVAGELFQ